jgi:ketosteroid isomerase-like protein
VTAQPRPVPGWARRTGHLPATPAPDAVTAAADRIAVAERIAAYGWAYDERDRTALARCFTADAEWRGTIMGDTAVGPFCGADVIADWLAGFWDTQPDQRRHLFTNVIAHVTSRRATASAYLVLLGTSDGSTVPVSAGPYSFDLAQGDDGHWRIAVLAAGFDAPF